MNPLRDLRYIHQTEYPPDGSVVFPGWIDANAYPWAAGLRLPGDCDDLFCPCHTTPWADESLHPSTDSATVSDSRSNDQ